MSKSKCLIDRISAEHLEDFKQRRLTSAQVARLYGVKPACVNRTLPKRPPRERVNPKDKADLRAARNAFRDKLALDIVSGKHTARQASELAHCSIRTIFRHLKRARHAEQLPPGDQHV